MSQFTQLEKVEPQEIFAEKVCKILQALLANIAVTDKNKISTFFTIIHKNSGKEINKKR